MADQWEYEVLALSWDTIHEVWAASGAMEFTSATLVESFNRMGEAGWEMVGLTPYSGVLTLGYAGGVAVPGRHCCTVPSSSAASRSQREA